MLLQEPKARVERQIQATQEQIDRLHKEQEQLQAYLQQLGSVESAMESAVKQVQTAIALGHKVCPDELADFHAKVNGLFDGTPVAELPEAVDPVESEPVEPQTDPNDDGDAIAVEVKEIPERWEKGQFVKVLSGVREGEVWSVTGYEGPKDVGIERAGVEALELEDNLEEYVHRSGEVADTIVRNSDEKVRLQAAGSDVLDFSDWSMKDLRQECRDRGIDPKNPKYGNGKLNCKQTYIDALEDNR
ncbi:MAG: hypothetical protein J7647_30890 [Cyanobacteria bacterium SBLK]|nr:hypothetical protein [Cyanobacteria bacterium SBLK]